MNDRALAVSLGSDPALRLWTEKRNSFQLCGYGRYAMYETLHRIHPRRGAQYAVPAFICAEALEPFQVAGVSLTKYDIEEDFLPSVETLEKLVPLNLDGILLVNYFGMIAERSDIVFDWCRSQRWCIVEDNTQAFLSGETTVAGGARGDVGIFSFRKTVPLPNGAGVLINRLEFLDRFSNWPALPTPTLSAKSWIRLILLLLRDHFDMPWSRRRLLRDCARYCPLPWPQASVGMAPISTWLLDRCNFRKVRQTRQSDYMRIVAAIANQFGYQPLVQNLPPSICPVAVPYMVRKSENAVRKLRQQHFRADYWPSSSPEWAETRGIFDRKLAEEFFLVHLGY